MTDRSPASLFHPAHVMLAALQRAPILALLFMLIGIAGCDRGDGVTLAKSVAVNEPDRFARYINSNAGLPSGDYTIVVATAAAGESGSFSLSVAYDDGIEEIYEGSWTASGGQDQTDTANPSFDISLATAGGLTITLSADTADAYLYLLRRAAGADGAVDRSGPVFAENDDADVTTTNAQIAIAASRIESESFGQAYYDTIDPTDVKTTLEDWKLANGYYDALAAGRVIEPRFRDTKDLGYGRGMRAWTNPEGDFYSFVENFQVRTSSGNEYTDLNLDALINDTREHHFGSNAIEYSTWPYGPGEPCGHDSAAPCAITDTDPPRFNKFFTFDATQGSQVMQDHDNEVRLNTVNLDGRGLKAMPGACVYCHGGTVRPLRDDGSYRDNCYAGNSCNGINGDTNAKLQLLEVDSFAFWEESPNTQAEEEPKIKAVNRMIYCTYPGADPEACVPAFCVQGGSSADCDGSGNPVPVLSAAISNGGWSGAFAREMAEGWYDDPNAGSGSADWDRATFNGEYVPAGWDPDNVADQSRAGADELFLEVVQPICFVCHSRRGTNLGSDLAAGVAKDIDFSNYERFMSYAEQIKSYVFDRGVMPLSLRGYNAFWDDPDRPRLLASHINAELLRQGADTGDLVQLNATDEVDEPGVVVADAGPDRTAPSPLRLFASNTRFADTWSWEIISTPSGGETASLDDSAFPRPVFTAPVDGDYVIRLTASNRTGDSDTDTLNVKINSTVSPAPRDIVFSDVAAIFTQVTGDAGFPQCISCHASQADGGIVGIPVFWTATQPPTGSTRYQEVLARVDFEDPENSLILLKPSGNHHYGGLREGFEVSNPSNRDNYDLVLSWILEGARFDAANMREP